MSLWSAIGEVEASRGGEASKWRTRSKQTRGEITARLGRDYFPPGKNLFPAWETKVPCLGNNYSH